MEQKGKIGKAGETEETGKTDFPRLHDFPDFPNLHGFPNKKY